MELNENNNKESKNYRMILEESNKGICCCCNNKESLDEIEYYSYLKLIEICEEIYNKEDLSHKELLSYLESLGKDTINNNINISVWRYLGFQSESPENDFRAGGLLSLKFMIYSLEQNTLSLTNGINEYFLFALACIKIIYEMKIFLFLFSDINMKQFKKSNKYIIADKHQIKNYCLIKGFELNNFFLICAEILKQSYIKFSNNIDNKNIVNNYLNIETIINKCIVRFLF